MQSAENQSAPAYQTRQHHPCDALSASQSRKQSLVFLFLCMYTFYLFSHLFSFSPATVLSREQEVCTYNIAVPEVRVQMSVNGGQHYTCMYGHEKNGCTILGEPQDFLMRNTSKQQQIHLHTQTNQTEKKKKNQSLIGLTKPTQLTTE